MSSTARLRVTFHLQDAAADWAGSALSDFFPDGLLLVPQPGGVTRLQGWLKARAGRRTRAILARLALLGATHVRTKLQEAGSLKVKAQGRFPVLRLGHFRVIPAGQAPGISKLKNAWPIILVQGQAFGSGRHESTRLMLQSIEAHPPQGRTVLDVGAGSGILGFACLRLGASKVTALELESAACAELRRNRVLNGVKAARMPVLCGRFPLKRLVALRYPLVLANIITPVLVALMPALSAQAAPGGHLVCGGIHTDVEFFAVVSAARRCGLRLLRRQQLRRWNSLRFFRS